LFGDQRRRRLSLDAIWGQWSFITDFGCSGNEILLCSFAFFSNAKTNLGLNFYARNKTMSKKYALESKVLTQNRNRKLFKQEY
jgi:hypothetical protein